MANEDEKRAALRALYAQPQSTEAQRQQQQQMAQVRDLSQLRPVVRESVSEQERNARQVFTFVMANFLAIKPETERDMKRADSQLLRLHEMSRG